MVQQKFADYDENPTVLYQYCEAADWANASSRCRSHPEESEVWIYRRNPDKNSIRWCVLPIHQACARTAPGKIVVDLLKANLISIRKRSFQMTSESNAPGSVEQINFNEGNLPVHFACQYGLSTAIVEMMFKAFPDSVRIKDKRGLTPLQIAEQASYETKDEIVEIIENAIEEQAEVREKEKEMTPMQRSMALKERKSRVHADRKATTSVREFENKINATDYVEPDPVAFVKPKMDSVKEDAIEEDDQPKPKSEPEPVEESKPATAPAPAPVAAAPAPAAAPRSVAPSPADSGVVAALNAQIETLEAENALLRKQASGEAGPDADAEYKKGALEATIEMLENEVDSLTAKLSEGFRASAAAELQASVDALEAENAALQEAGQLGDDLLETAAAPAGESDSVLKATVELLESRNEELQEKIDSLETEIQTMNKFKSKKDLADALAKVAPDPTNGGYSSPSAPAASGDPYEATVLVANTKKGISTILNQRIVAACVAAIEDHDCFTIALSGGSLPSFLTTLPFEFEALGVDAQFDKWYVLLADERVVPPNHDDNNMKALKSAFLKYAPVPLEHIYDIEPGRLGAMWDEENLTNNVAQWYEKEIVGPILKLSNGLDLAVLGFGPDGHTCSLFPDHPLLEESSKMVAPIMDSPKPPSNRITLTFPVLNDASNVIFCGAGASKNPILKGVFEEGKTVSSNNDGILTVTMTDPSPFPCGMVRPSSGNIFWVVDSPAAEGL